MELKVVVLVAIPPVHFGEILLIRKVERMILTCGWDHLEDIWKRRAEKLLDDDQIDALIRQRETSEAKDRILPIGFGHGRPRRFQLCKTADRCLLTARVAVTAKKQQIIDIHFKQLLSNLRGRPHPGSCPRVLCNGVRS